MTEQPEIKTKNDLKQNLGAVLDVSLEKFNKQRCNVKDRQAWARLIIYAIKGYSDLLDSEQLEKIEADIQKIKEKIGMKET